MKDNKQGWEDFWYVWEEYKKYGKNQMMKENKETEVVTQVSIKSGNPNWNPVFNSLKVGPDDEGGGSYLKIIGEDIDASKDVDGEGIRLDWGEWDKLVEVVAKYRKDWEYDKGTQI